MHYPLTTSNFGTLVSIVTVIVTGCNGEAPPTFEQFSAAVTENGYETAPTFIQYKFFRKFMENGGYSKREAAMILAHMIHQTAGLTEKVEQDCETKCANGDYRGSGMGGENEKCETIGSRASLCYCGRGYLQLTWCSNYERIGQELDLGDNLVDNPTEVANKEDLSWATAFKFWHLHVRHLSQVQDGQFGATTNAIYGDKECGGLEGTEEARSRFKKYAVIHKQFGLQGEPDPSGCYGDEMAKKMKTEL